MSAAAVRTKGVAAEFLADAKPLGMILNCLLPFVLIERGQVAMSIDSNTEQSHVYTVGSAA